MMLSLDRFADLSDVLGQWTAATMSRQFDEAERIAGELVARCKEVAQDSAVPLPAPAGEKNGAVVVGILARGLQGYVDVLRFRSAPNWHAAPANVEAMWSALCDAVARLDHAAAYLNHPTLDSSLRTLAAVREEIDSRFGRGVYVSPVLVVEKFLCSVCGEDHRRCAHIVNRLYGGVRCIKVPTRLLRLASVDIVEVPEDPRCRIWPWNRTDDPPGFKNICVITSFRPDDYLDVPEILESKLRLARSEQPALTRRSRRRRKARRA
jgi:hypothetical protein